MKYHCKIDLPGWQDVADRCMWIIENHTDLLARRESFNLVTDEHRDGIFKMIKSLLAESNITLQRLGVILSDRDNITNVTEIHRDHTASTCRARINIPLNAVCSKSRTNFFTIKHENPVTKILDNGLYYFVYDPTDCELVDSYILDSPTVINVTEPHNVEFFTNELRISLTCFVDPDPVELLDENV